MGRAKLNMELISKEKSRNITFKKRKEGLIRKMHEFTTLCDVSACMIIYGPKQEKGLFVEPEVWPQNNMDEVRRIIAIYKAKNKDSGNKTFGLSDFFHDRKRKVEDELAKLRKKTMEAKYPTWLEFMNFMTEARLREFALALINKADYVKSRIEFLRRTRSSSSDHQGLGLGSLDMKNLMDFSRLAQSHHMHFNSPGPGLRGVELEIINQQAISSHYPPAAAATIDHQYQNSMMMLLMNDNDHRGLQFGGAAAAGSSNIQCASSYRRQVFYETLEPACHSPKPLARYYGPSLPVQVGPLPYVQMVPAQMQFPARENNNGGDGIGGEDFVTQYQMNYINRARYYD